MCEAYGTARKPERHNKVGRRRVETCQVSLVGQRV